MLFYELQPDQKSVKTHWRLSKRQGRDLYFRRDILEKILLQFDFLGDWSEQRFTLNVVERVIPVNESPVILLFRLSRFGWRIFIVTKLMHSIQTAT
jgi:hypothetical protein